MKDKKFKKLLKVTKNLIKKNNQTTTLEVKQVLRAKYPNQRWTQQDVSNALDEAQMLQHIDGLMYIDNGSYREYYIIKPDPVVSSKVTSGSANRTALVQQLKDTAGQIVTIIFTKKNGEQRTMTGKVDKNNFFTNLGYIKFKEGNLTKNVDPRTLEFVGVYSQFTTLKV